MAINKLQWLCLFVLTICVVISDIKCLTRKECRQYILRTNHMISLLNDEGIMEFINPPDNAYLEEVDASERIAGFIFPPGTEELIRRVNENDPIYRTIYNNERAIQRELVRILGFERPRFTGSSSYNTAVMKRRYLLNSTFHYILNDRLKNVKMCANNESMKCALVGLIKRTLNYPLKNKYECTDNGNCVITVREFISGPGRSMRFKIPIREKTYRDHFDTNQTCYKTLFLDPSSRVLKDWDNSRIEEIVESPPSDEE
ncbi:uncharacterized protein LOC126846444 isoform X2 [Adelges cooleyi]|uniref:uncharacterized protein LOC126846444 isoform X2 n=1 Tax=Adelges cooleyi TaxID=133065 RepID=UPI00217F55B9|nr:uncharacterized protein LOC126846444 isoform X2 [Adelges cooleyi]